MTFNEILYRKQIRALEKEIQALKEDKLLLHHLLDAATETDLTSAIYYQDQVYITNDTSDYNSLDWGGIISTNTLTDDFWFF